LEVAIFIVDGTKKYQWTDNALTNLLVCRSCSERACGLCKPLACLMAWAHRKVKLSKIVPRGRQAKFLNFFRKVPIVKIAQKPER
jgi:hypothetical protein